MIVLNEWEIGTVFGGKESASSGACQVSDNMQISGNAGAVFGGGVAGAGLLFGGPSAPAWGAIGGAIALAGSATAGAGYLIGRYYRCP